MKSIRNTIVFIILSILASYINLSFGLPNKHDYFNKKIIESKYASWGISPKYKKSSINLSSAWSSFQKNGDVIVALIDTGIDPKHPFITNNIHVIGGKKNKENFGRNFSKSKKGSPQTKTAPRDDHGHGTHVAGIIKSVFPEVKILPIKYFNQKASGEENLNSTILALKYAVDSNVDIINYSGGGPEPSPQELEILKIAEKKGILIVAAAGNEKANIDNKANAYYPASYRLKNIITVTAHDHNCRILSSSNYGKRSVDISAPGYQIRSILPKGRTGYLTGTSQATAFVTGVAALLKSQFPRLTSMQIKELIIKSAQQDLNLMGRVVANGKLDAASAIVMASKKTGRKIANNEKLKLKKTIANRPIFFPKKKLRPFKLLNPLPRPAMLRNKKLKAPTDYKQKDKLKTGIIYYRFKRPHLSF